MAPANHVVRVPDRQGDRRMRQLATTDSANTGTASCTLCHSTAQLRLFRGKPVCEPCLQEAHEVMSRTRDQVL